MIQYIDDLLSIVYIDWQVLSPPNNSRFWERNR